MFLRRRDTLIEAGILLALVAILAAFFIDLHPDRAYITYRYARNLSDGRGLLYNFGEPTFLSGAASAPYAILLAIGTVVTTSIPTMANIFGVLAIAAAAILTAQLAEPSGRLSSRLAGCFILVSPLLWSGVGLETPLWLALCLAGFRLHLRGAGVGTAICLGLATLIRPDTAILVALLVAHAFYIRRPLIFLPTGVYTGVAGVGGLAILSIFHASGLQSAYLPPALAAILPDALGGNVLSGLAGQLGALVGLSLLWVLALILCAAGLVRIRAHPWAALLAIWSVLHLIVLGVMDVGILPRDLAPLVPTLAGLLALGAEVVLERVPEGRVRWGAFAAISLISAGTAFYSSLTVATTSPADAHDWRALAGSAPDPRIESAAAWLRQNAPPDAVVATSRSGLLGYLAGQPMLDYYGALQPDVGDAAARGDTSWWLMAYSPGYVVVDSSELVSAGGNILAHDEWFAANYSEVARFDAEGASTIIFRRTTPAQPVTESLIGFTNYPDGLTINGIASDFALFPMQGGRTGLIRLEWLLNFPIPAPQTVTIRIQGRGGGAVAGLATRIVDFSHWPQHQLITTFHAITLAPDLPSGVYDVEVGIGPDANTQTFNSIAVAKVPFQGGTDLGGISGTRAEFGDISLLGYRVGQRPEGLEVFLLWQADHAIAADYHTVVQVRDANGAVVASQDVQPHNGAYPTSVWSPGEQVTDTILLAVSQTPPGEYDVYVSLTTPDGVFVRAADGKDAVFVGHITLASP